MVNKMLEAKIAEPYGEALYQLGLSLYLNRSNSQEFYNLVFHIQDFVKLLHENPTLNDYLTNPLVPSKDKKNLLKQCVNKNIHPNGLNFLYLLIDRKRINCIESIGEYFLEKSNSFFSIKYVEIISAVDLTEEQQETLSTKLATMFTPFYRERPLIRLKISVDPSILGGFILKSASKITDLSVRGELKDFGKRLGVSL